jgi:hypothetical protein
MKGLVYGFMMSLFLGGVAVAAPHTITLTPEQEVALDWLQEERARQDDVAPLSKQDLLQGIVAAVLDRQLQQMDAQLQPMLEPLQGVSPAALAEFRSKIGRGPLRARLQHLLGR